MNIYNDKVTHRFGEQEPNHVLPPPPINPDEIKLTRTARSRLSQLRSGFSRLLNSYLNRLDDKIENKCPKCQTTPVYTNHLFNCQANPTSLHTSTLSKPLTSLDWKNSKILTQDEATTTTTWARNRDVLCTLYAKLNRFNTNLK